MAEPLKHLIDEAVVETLRARLDLPRSFAVEAASALSSLELKDRVRHLSRMLHKVLPAEFPAAVDRILGALPPPSQDDQALMGEVWVWPLAQFIEDYGCNEPELSLLALHAITQRFSAEFAVRPFIDQHPELTLAMFASWVDDPNLHVRRLVSEGSRPRLPWGQRLPGVQHDPQRTLALLERLKDDPEEYVRRSVANHLNDISKDHPDLVTEVARRWLAEDGADRKALVRHALRGLIKGGHAGALDVLGFGPPQVTVEDFTVTPDRVLVGGALTIRGCLRSDATQSLIVDYAVHHRKANGKSSAKVFKGRTAEVALGDLFTWEKEHSLRPVTTRRYYPGAHRVELLVNGQALAEASFELLET